MIRLTFQVNSMSSAGQDRVNVSFTQVTTTPDPEQPPMYAPGANLNLNLAQADAAAYDVNGLYTLELKAQK